MNIVFYVLVLLGAALIYFLLSYAFGFIGKSASNMANKFKENIDKDYKEEGEDENEIK